MKQFREMGAMIRHLANQKDISMKELAELINVSEIDIERLCWGRVYLSYNQLFKLAERLDVTINLLIDDSKEKEEIFVQSITDHRDLSADEIHAVIDIIGEYLDVVESVEGDE